MSINMSILSISSLSKSLSTTIDVEINMLAFIYQYTFNIISSIKDT